MKQTCFLAPLAASLALIGGPALAGGGVELSTIQKGHRASLILKMADKVFRGGLGGLAMSPEMSLEACVNALSNVHSVKGSCLDLQTGDIFQFSYTPAEGPSD